MANLAQRVCDEPGCERPRFAKGLCKRHYARRWRDSRGERVDREPREWGGTLPGEVWRPLPGRESEYLVSSHGRVRSVDRQIENAAGGRCDAYARFVRGRLLSQRTARGGYRVVSLSGAHPGNRLVHRLVAEAFVGPAPDGYQVNHRNGDKLDNRPENLEYVTPSENTQHAYDTGLQKRGEGHYNAKLTEEAVLSMRANRGRLTYKQMADRYGVTVSTVKTVISSRSWAHID